MSAAEIAPEGESSKATGYDVPMAEHLKVAITQDWDPAPPMPHPAQTPAPPRRHRQEAYMFG